MMDTELGDEYEELRMVGCEKSPPANRKLCWDKLQSCILAIESKYKNNISNYINLQSRLIPDQFGT